ncbi:unknown [Cestrum yellow leaf curling virus]|uniref:Uncharacterized protein 1a n=1 Tax=Cestrum yellow leaf curling virus TaxID=175814 RepID=Y1A_CYLCV|nr:hypothetical protein [Cestrum yellow leaf curling virus]Q7TD12.1 RecName: Full=Uncharacterized protein 1a [Cestrum yellow leaf curling virus]AAP78920.1 unknown [Cestrum yellow leaf curling virus]
MSQERVDKLRKLRIEFEGIIQRMEVAKNLLRELEETTDRVRVDRLQMEVGFLRDYADINCMIEKDRIKEQSSSSSATRTTQEPSLHLPD